MIKEAVLPFRCCFRHLQTFPLLALRMVSGLFDFIFCLLLSHFCGAFYASASSLIIIRCYLLTFHYQLDKTINRPNPVENSVVYLLYWWVSDHSVRNLYVSVIFMSEC